MTLSRALSLETLCDSLEAASETDEIGYTFLQEGGGVDHLSFALLAEQARARAAALRALGLADGDRVAVILPDNREFIVTFFAAMLARLVPVPMYPPLALGRLEGYLDTATGIAASSGASAIVTSEALRRLLWPIAARVGSVRVVTTPEKLDEIDARPLVAPRTNPEDLAFLQFTSGSTAAPKGVMVTHRGLVANVRATLEEILAGPGGEDRGLSWLPLYHDMGLIGFVVAPLYCRRHVILMPALTFLKRPERWFQALHDHAATVTFAPNFAYALAVKRLKDADVARWDLSRVRVFGCGAEPVRADTLRAFVDRFQAAGVTAHSLLPCYGMAEATLAVTCHSIGEPLRVTTVDAEQLRAERRAVTPQTGEPALDLVSCGRPLKGHQVRIVDEHGGLLPERKVGEIEVSGPSVAAGYFGDEAASRATFVDGWLRTGDLGFIVDGELFVSGRKKDLIIIGGRNYAPEQIEAVIAAVPGVRAGNVVAFGRPGSRGTDEVVAVCESRSLDHAAIVDAVRTRASEEIGVMVSDVLVLQPGTLPKTSSGKLQRARTRALYLDGTLARQGNRTPAAGITLLLMARHLAASSWSRLRYILRSIRWNHPSS